MAVVLAALVAGCSTTAEVGRESGADTTTGGNITAPPAGQPVDGGRIVVGLSAETNSLSPVTGQWAGQGYQVGRAIFDPLAAYDQDGELHPYLAESFEHDDEFRRWTIRLRPGVTFHDGTACDAAAVKQNFDAQIASPVSGQVFRPIREVVAVDPLTVEVTMTEPWSTFADYLTSQLGYMAAPATLADPQGGDRPLGTGPFEVVEWQRDKALEVRKNEDYWRPGLPHLDAIEFRVITDPGAQVQSLQSGDTDIAEGLWPSSIVRLREEADAAETQLFQDPRDEVNVITLALNTGAAPFDDLEARRAVASAIDSDALSSQVFQGVFDPTRTLLASNAPGRGATDYPAFDQEQARRLARSYRDRTGSALAFSMLVPSDSAALEAAQAVQAQLAEVDIAMEVKTSDQATLLAAVLAGSYQSSAWVLFGGRNYEANNVFLDGDNAKPVGELALAFTRFDDADVDGGLDALRRTDDLDGQAAATRRIEQALGRGVPFVWLVRTASVLGVSNRLRGVDAASFPDGRPLMDVEGINLWLAQAWVAG